MMESVSWDDDIPNIWNNKSHVPNHQPEIHQPAAARAVNPISLISVHTPLKVQPPISIDEYMSPGFSYCGEIIVAFMGHTLW